MKFNVQEEDRRSQSWRECHSVKKSKGTTVEQDVKSEKEKDTRTPSKVILVTWQFGTVYAK